jgi:hypothetical protein
VTKASTPPVAPEIAPKIKRWSLPHWTALVAAALFLDALIIRSIPFQYDTPSREIVAILVAVNGFEMLIWLPFGAFVLVRFWKRLPILYRIIMAIDIGFAIALLFNL